jgi:hypothetical protein
MRHSHRNSRLGVAALTAALALSPLFALASPIPDGGVTAEDVAAVLQAKGYSARIDKDSDGDPLIHSGAQGSNFGVYFFGCHKTPRCTSFQFAAAYHVDGGMTLAQINGWNHSMRFGRAYLDNVNDPFVEMDLDVEKGFTTEAIDNNIDTWDSLLGSFRRFVDCAKKPAGDPCKATDGHGGG